MSYKRFQQSDGQTFNSLLGSAPFNSILQTTQWGQLKSSFGWKPHYLVYDNIHTITILERKVPYTGNTFLYSPHPYIPSREFIEDLIKFSKKYFRKAILLKLEPHEGTNPDVIRVMNLVPSSRVQPRSTIKVNLIPDEDDIMTKCHKKTRYNTRLAERRGVKIIRDNTHNGINKLMRLLHNTADRKNFLVHSESYYIKMFDVMSKDDMGSVFLAEYKGEIVAGLYALKFGDTAYYPYGASDDRFSKHMPSNLLHWEVMRWAKSEGCSTYDLWGIPDNPTKNSPMWGVYRFKSGWGGEEIKRLGAYDIVLKPDMYKLWCLGLRTWNGLRNFIARGSFGDPLG